MIAHLTLVSVKESCLLETNFTKCESNQQSIDIIEENTTGSGKKKNPTEFDPINILHFEYVI